jgi:hypothetical protein
VERSAVQQSFPGNVFDRAVSRERRPQGLSITLRSRSKNISKKGLLNRRSLHSAAAPVEMTKGRALLRETK